MIPGKECQKFPVKKIQETNESILYIKVWNYRKLSQVQPSTGW